MCTFTVAKHINTRSVGWKKYIKKRNRKRGPLHKTRVDRIFSFPTLYIFNIRGESDVGRFVAVEKTTRALCNLWTYRVKIRRWDFSGYFSIWPFVFGTLSHSSHAFSIAVVLLHRELSDARCTLSLSLYQKPTITSRIIYKCVVEKIVFRNRKPSIVRHFLALLFRCGENMRKTNSHVCGRLVLCVCVVMDEGMVFFVRPNYYRGSFSRTVGNFDNVPTPPPFPRRALLKLHLQNEQSSNGEK